MTDKQRLEIYLANLDKALGLVDDTDDLSFSTSGTFDLVNHKLDIYNSISKLMDMIEKDIKGE